MTGLKLSLMASCGCVSGIYSLQYLLYIYITYIYQLSVLNTELNIRADLVFLALVNSRDFSYRAFLLRTIFVSLARANELARVQSVRDFPQTKLDSVINARFFLNEHHFLFYENNILNNATYLKPFFWDVDEETIKESRTGVIQHAVLENNRAYLLRTEITKSHLNNRIFQHCGVKISTVTPSFYYVFNISLSCNINIPSFIGNLWWVLLLGNHFNTCF